MSSPSPRIERLHELGRGATSRVDLARLRDAYREWPEGHLIAVKSLLPEFVNDDRARAALEEEALAASEARHPSLMEVYFTSEDERGPFLALEFVPGDDLQSILDGHEPLPEARVRSIGADLAGALAALHAVGRVHGDLKPANARLDASDRAVLIDLGFARRTADSHDATPGSLAYLAPEVAGGGPPASASDVFALGVVLHELATGHHPFLSEHLREPDRSDEGDDGQGDDRDPTRHLGRLQDLAQERFVPPSRHAPELSPFFDAQIEELLAPAASDRPSALELARRMRLGEEHEWWQTRLRTRVAPRARPLRAVGMVGRGVELKTLERALAALRPAPERDARSGDAGAARGAAAWLSGPAGSGKSRLVAEFAARARVHHRPPLYLYARASIRRESRPLGTLLRLLRRWLNTPTGRPLGPAARSRLEHTVAPRDAQVLAEALGPEGEELPNALPSALSSWLEALAGERPVIVFVDDLHRADEATLAALGLFVRELHDTEALLVLGVREDEPTAQPEALARLRARLTELASRRDPLPLFDIELGPLDEAAVLALVAQRFHSSAPRLRLARLLWERSLGNPGLLAEILRSLEESGGVEPSSTHDPRWRLLVRPDELPYPESLERAIEDRFERLDPTAREWLARMSVIGGRFDARVLAATFGRNTREEIDAILVHLSEAGWLEPGGGQYRFQRPALQDAVHESLDEKVRAELHAAVSDALESDPDASWDNTFDRAYHLREAGRTEQLAEVLLPMLDKIPEHGQPQRTLTLARWGIAACREAGAPPERMLDLYETAVDAANRLGRRRDERELLDRMIELPLDLERSPALAARVYLAHGRHALGIGDLGLARGWFTNAVQLAESARSLELACDAQRRLAVVHGLSGELDRALELAGQALDNAPDPRRRAFAWLVVAQVHALENRVSAALEAIDSARHELAQLDEAGLSGARGAVDMLSARVYRSAGRQGRALGAANRAVRRARRSGDRRLEVEASARLGGLLIDLDRLDDAEAHLRDALTLAREIEDRGGAALAGLWLGILLWERDDDGAMAEIARTVETAGELGLYRLKALALAIEARQHHAAGAMDRALSASRTAEELLERYGAELSDRIVITGTRSLVLHAAGRRGDARTLVRELRRRMREENRAHTDPELRRSQHRYGTRLLEAVLSPDGPVYPRTSAAD